VTTLGFSHAPHETDCPLTPEQINAIEQMVSGRAPTLLLPMSLRESFGPQRSGFPDGTHAIIPPTYAEISATQSSARDLFADLQTADLTLAVYELASLNVLLDRLATDAAFQRTAVAQYVRPEFRNPKLINQSAPSPDYEFIINGIGVMIALKGVIGVERPIGPMLATQFKVGDLILRANQFVSGTRFDGTVRDQDDADVAAETICTWDLTNPRDVGYEPARIIRMLELIEAPDKKVSTLREKLGILQSELRFAGLPIIDFLAVVFGIDRSGARLVFGCSPRQSARRSHR
jgi:hypothetical protein